MENRTHNRPPQVIVASVQVQRDEIVNVILEIHVLDFNGQVSALTVSGVEPVTEESR